MLQIAVPSVLQQSTVSIGMMIVQAVVNPFGTQALAGYAATMRVENVFSLIFVSIGNAVSPYAVSYTHLDVYKRQSMEGYGKLEDQNTFAVIGATIADNFEVKMPEGTIGSSLLDELK